MTDTKALSEAIGRLRDVAPIAGDFAIVCNALEAILPKPIAEAPKDLDAAILFHPNWLLPEISALRDTDGEWHYGDWEGVLKPTHFIPLSALPLPEEAGE